MADPERGDLVFWNKHTAVYRRTMYDRSVILLGTQELEVESCSCIKIAPWTKEYRQALRKSLDVHPFRHIPSDRPRKGTYYTTEDADDTKAQLKEHNKMRRLHRDWDVAIAKKRRLDHLHEDWDAAEAEEDIKRRWKQLGTDGVDRNIIEPGIFKVTHASRAFIVVAKSEGDARRIHPDGGDAFTYKGDALERNEKWQRMGHSGMAPDWYLGDDGMWCHGAFCKVERIGDVAGNAEYGTVACLHI